MKDWPVRPDAVRVRHAEVQAIPWWLVLAGAVGAVVVWQWSTQVVIIAVGFIWMQTGWRRRRIRVDDRYLWAGLSGLRLADVAGTEQVAGSEMAERSALAKHHAWAPGPSADKTRAWIRRAVVVKARTLEGIEFEWVVSSRDPQRLKEAVLNAAAKDAYGRDPALLPDPEGPEEAPPRPTGPLRDLLRTSPLRGAFRERTRTPWWAWAIVPVVMGAIMGLPALYLAATGAPDPYEGMDAVGIGMLTVVAAAVLLMMAIGDQRVVQVDGGCLQAGKARVDLARVASARVVGRAELLNLGQRFSCMKAPRRGVGRFAVWSHYGLLLATHPAPGHERGVLYLVGTSHPEELLVAVTTSLGVHER